MREKIQLKRINNSNNNNYNYKMQVNKKNSQVYFSLNYFKFNKSNKNQKDLKRKSRKGKINKKWVVLQLKLKKQTNQTPVKDNMVFIIRHQSDNFQRCFLREESQKRKTK